MDNLYAINVAKTEFREGFNLGDVARILATADPDLVNFSSEQPSGFGKSGLDDLAIRLQNLFEQFAVKLAVIVVEIRIQGDVAYDYGWHDLTLTAQERRCTHSSPGPLCGYLAEESRGELEIMDVHG